MNEKLFKKVDLKVQRKSGFDKSHTNLFTTKVGTLTPVLCDEVIPNSTVDLKLNLSASLPPLASDTFMRVDLKAEAFFVPYRLCYGGFEDWFVGNQVNYQPGNEAKVGVKFPVLKFSTWNEVKSGSLADYLGYRVAYSDSAFTSGATSVNPLPFVAYHRIWDDWYRNSLIQKSAFIRLIPNTTSLTANNPTKWNAATLPYFEYIDSVSSTGHNIISSRSNQGLLNDGKYLTDLRQRNFGYDYFTTATQLPQNGEQQKVSFTVESVGTETASGGVTVSGSSSISIPAIRAANSLQQFMERNNLAGDRFVDRLKAHYGANLKDGIAQRPLLLGSASFNVYSKGIYQTANQESASYTNPFSQSVGAEFGKAYASGSDFIIKGFTAEEPGIIMVLVSLVPKVTYSTGIRRMLTHYIGGPSVRDGKNGQVDLANPILQNTGNQQIYGYELNGKPNDTSIFGYTDRYAEWKTMDDELHGLVRDGENLQTFALQRSFTESGNSISSSFLEIPVDYMDQVAAVQDSISDYGVWVDSFMDYKVSMPLAEYALPSLQDPAYEHGVDVSINRAGTHL